MWHSFSRSAALDNNVRAYDARHPHRLERYIFEDLWSFQQGIQSQTRENIKIGSYLVLYHGLHYIPSVRTRSKLGVPDHVFPGLAGTAAAAPATAMAITYVL